MCDTLEGDERTGAKIVLKALEAPLRQIAKNAGLEGSVIIDKIISANKPNYGFDAQNEVFVEDMIAAGIVDPTKVTRSALENAASVAEMVLTTESLVADLPEPPTFFCHCALFPSHFAFSPIHRRIFTALSHKYAILLLRYLQAFLTVAESVLSIIPIFHDTVTLYI